MVGNGINDGIDVTIHNLDALLQGHVNGKVLDQKITRLTAPGDNYGSLMLRVDITVKNEDKEEIIHAVAKCVPPNKEMQVIFNIPITFKNEIGWYTTVIPTALELQKEEGVKKVADFFMKIYGARFSLDPNSEEIDDDAVILCENLAVQGYGNVDRRTGFNLDQSKAILKKLATFHALTMALKIKKPEVFEQKVKKYLHKLEDKDDNKIDAFRPTIKFLKGHPETSHLVPKVLEALKYIGPKSNSLEVREPWISAIHTDFWVNNIMLKEEEGGKPPQVIILDLQTCGYGSPVDDLLFFLGSSVQTHLAEQHFDELIKLYYIELMENLKFLNIDTNLFPYGSFQKELELQAPSQFAHSMFFVGIIMAERGKAIDTTAKDFNPETALFKMFENITPQHEEKYVFLTKAFAKRNWI